jgi:hypothetical protein
MIIGGREMKRLGGILVGALLLATTLVLVPSALGQARDAGRTVEEDLSARTPEVDLLAAYYAETGHNVSGELAAFFWENGAEPRLGRPLSEPFASAEGEVQVFDYVVALRTLEGEVQLLPAGRLAEAVLSLPPSIVISERLSAFYDENGGEAWFGAPVASAVVEGDALYQTFEFAMLQAEPGPEGDVVSMGELGVRYLLGVGAPASAVAPASPWTDALLGETGMAPRTAKPVEALDMPMVVSGLGALSVEASVRFPRTGRSGNQIVRAAVRDSAGGRLSGAVVQLLVRYPDRNTRLFSGQAGADGIAEIIFPVDASSPGQPILVDLVVTSGSIGGRAQLDFTPAW